MESHSRLTVRVVGVRGLDLALGRPVETAAGVMRTAPPVLIDLATEQGVTGRSYLRCYTPVALRALVRLVANPEELVKGDAAEPVAVQRKLQRHFRLLGPQGLAGMAVASIEMALWDARASAVGVPLVTLLGGTPKPIPAYTGLRTMNPTGAVAEAEEMLSLGFTALQAKLGRGDLAADLETIRTIRHAVGDRIDLMVDYNQSLSIAQAIDRVRLLDEEGLYWIEEPTRADDYQGHARITAAARTPIQLGDNWWGPYDMETSIAVRAWDHVTLDVMKLGGVTGWLRATALAKAAGLPASSHTFPKLSVHLLAVTPTCRWLEYLDHAGAILIEPTRIRDGHAAPPGRPGGGPEENEKLVERLLAA